MNVSFPTLRVGARGTFCESTHAESGWSAYFGILEVSKIGSVERVEYSSPKELKSVSGNYFIIPASLIVDKDLDEKRVSVFSYFSTKRGLDNNIEFSINSIVKWMNRKVDRHVNGINNKILNIVQSLVGEGYLTLLSELSNVSYMNIEINLDKITELCDKSRFAVIYIDELQKIINYKNPNPKDTFNNVDTILLVFAYLRMMIYRRRNKLFPEEINSDKFMKHENDINARRLRSPEAYNCFYYEIAEELGLSSRVVSNAVNILFSLDLIYYEPLPRIKVDNKWRTDHTIFCNTYKREGSHLLDSGSSYYLTEVKNKKKKLNFIKKGDD